MNLSEMWIKLLGVILSVVGLSLLLSLVGLNILGFPHWPAWGLLLGGVLFLGMGVVLIRGGNISL